MNYSLHPEAEADLDSIIDRYLRQFGLKGAERFLNEYQPSSATSTESPVWVVGELELTARFAEHAA